MSSLFRASDAASLAVHAAVLLAETPDARRRTGEMAEVLKVSSAHLAKVLQRLEQASLVIGTRGPSGGYRLARPAKAISLAEIYEAVEGSLNAERCPFDVPVCNGRGCVLGGFFGALNKKAKAKLARTRLSEVHLKLGGRK
jgi:Rrf2 family protein